MTDPFCQPTTTTPAPYDQLLGYDPSALCSLPLSPFVIEGLIRNMLINHFSSADNIQDPSLRGLLWNGLASGNILIEAFYTWKPESTDTRPAVIIRRNSLANRRISIGDRLHGGVDVEGNEHFVTQWVGSSTLFCIGQSGTQAELLGFEVQRELTEFAPELLTYVNKLKRFQAAELGGMVELEEARERYTTPVTVGYRYDQTWVVRPRVPRLKRIILQPDLGC